MLRPAIGSGDEASDEDVTEVSLSDDVIVQGVLLFGSRMLPGGLLLGIDSIGYGKFMHSTYAEKTKPVLIAVSMVPVSDHWRHSLIGY